MRNTGDIEQGDCWKELSPRIVERLTLPLLCALFALDVGLFLFKAGKIPLLCTQLLFALFAAVYLTARLHRLGWSWSGRTEAWRSMKGWAVSNCKKVTYYVVIFLYASALLFPLESGTDSRYFFVVSILTSALIVVAKVAGRSRSADSTVVEGLGVAVEVSL